MEYENTGDTTTESGLRGVVHVDSPTQRQCELSETSVAGTEQAIRDRR